jgi:8-amino-7-oxononanoate synthase
MEERGDIAHSPGAESHDPFSKLLDYTRVSAARVAGIYQYFPVFESAQCPVIKHEGRDVIMLGTNSYLGLATHPDVKAAMHRAIDEYGSACSGSPLLNGTLDIHRELASRLARFSGKEDALLYSTGYQANVGALSAILGRHDIVVMDKRSHASLVDGARLSGAKLARYEHNDLESLEAQLKRHSGQPVLVVTDSLFSMEGTVADLPGIVGLARRYGARLMLDESHAIGVLGARGAGAAESFGLVDAVDLIMGTFSKSLASVGGFVAGSRKVIDSLRHLSRGHVFSASLPPAAVAATLAALDIVERDGSLRERLASNAAFLAGGLRSLGFEVGAAEGPIVPVHCGHELLALSAYRKLFEDGVFVNPVLHPAVPKGCELLRVSLMATHDEATLSRALDIFARARTPWWPAPHARRKDA